MSNSNQRLSFIKGLKKSYTIYKTDLTTEKDRLIKKLMLFSVLLATMGSIPLILQQVGQKEGIPPILSGFYTILYSLIFGLSASLLAACMIDLFARITETYNTKYKGEVLKKIFGCMEGRKIAIIVSLFNTKEILREEYKNKLEDEYLMSNSDFRAVKNLVALFKEYRIDLPYIYPHNKAIEMWANNEFEHYESIICVGLHSNDFTKLMLQKDGNLKHLYFDIYNRDESTIPIEKTIFCARIDENGETIRTGDTMYDKFDAHKLNRDKGIDDYAVLARTSTKIKVSNSTAPNQKCNINIVIMGGLTHIGIERLGKFLQKQLVDIESFEDEKRNKEKLIDQKAFTCVWKVKKKENETQGEASEEEMPKLSLLFKRASSE